ncbi:Immunogenic protein MPT70 precursor [Corynebacterium occultum]|uniref:Immunogenic protein MPT70 n=1 Tax=Corynebacterium occultum TaxID=2675219 RepID=A0A6B8VT24_9CORY|nr:fasciclin domain-containing protein [Corynebacterium occultum]QGU06189.1 Immunogenic protein MPT70 precursor [Corynebacterium occultum]
MKRIIALSGAVSLALALGACATDEDAGTTTTATMEETTTEETATEEATTEAPEASTDIVDTAVAAGSFTTLATALEAADLVETLKGPGPFTVFAPTDEAFDALPEGTLDELLADPTGDLSQILQYHVVSGEVMAADVLELDGQTVETIQGSDLTVEVEGENVALIDAAGNRVNVVDTDIAASNGVIHVLDGVLMPNA